MNVRKRRVVSLVLAVLMFVLNVPVYADNGFSDVTPNHWAYEKITDFVNKGYVKGYEDNTFKPDNFVTRAEFIYMINNYYGFTGNEDKIADFPDVNQNEWYAKGINEAFARGYIGGYEDGTFRPNTIISRQEALLIIARILDIADDEMPEDSENYLSQYADYKDIANWAKKAVYNCLIKGIIKGYGDGTLRINEPAKRAESICLFYTPEEKIIVEEEKKEEEKKTTGGGSGGGSRPRPTTTPSTSPSPSVEPSESPEVTETPSPSVEPSESPEITPTPTPEEECACGECLNELVKVLEDIAKAHLDLLVNELKEANGNTEELKEVIEKWLKEEIDNSEYKDQIYELIDELQKIDYEAEAQKVLEKIEEIIYSDMIQDIVSKFEEKIAETISEEDKVKIKELVNSLKNETGISAEKIEELINEVIENHDCEEVEALVNKIINFLNNIESMEDLFNKVNDYLEGKISKEDIKDFIEKIAEELDLTAEELKEKIEDFIDEEKAEAKEAIEKIIEEIEKEKEEIEKIIKELAKELKVKEEELKKLAEKLLEEGKATIETLKEEMREEIEKIIEDLAKEMEVKKEELKKLAEKLLEEGKANLENLKEKLKEEIKNQIIENLPTEEELKEEFEKILEEIKDKISEDLPTDEELKDLTDKLETAIPKIEELTGVDLSEIANKLGIDVDDLKQLLDAVGGNEALQEKLEETIKNKLVDALVSTLSNNEDVQKVLEKIYEETDAGVIDLLLKALENGEIGEVIAKIILSNSSLADVLAAIDNNMANEKISDIIDLTVDYYGLVEVVKEIDYKDDTTLVNAKEILEIALKNAGLGDIAKLALDSNTMAIINSYFDVFELTEILGEQGKDIINGIWDDFDLSDLTTMLEEFKNDPEKINEIKEFIKNYFTTTTVNYDVNKPEKATNSVVGDLSATIHKNNAPAKLTSVELKLEGYEFLGWSKDKEISSEDELMDLDKEYKSSEFDYKEDVTLYAIWEALTSNIYGEYKDENGNKVSIKDTEPIYDDEKGTYLLGSAKTDADVTLKVEPATGYKLVEIKVNGNENLVDANNTFGMPVGDVEITATFSSTSHTIALTSNILAVVTAPSSAEENKTVTVTAKDGYRINSLTVKKVSDATVEVNKNNGTWTFTMPTEDVVIDGEIEQVYNVTIADGLEDEISVSVSKDVAKGEDVIVTISDDYELVEGTLKYNDTVITKKDGKYTFEMPASDVEITAEFMYKIENANSDETVMYVVQDIETILNSINVEDGLENALKNALANVSVEKAKAGQVLSIVHLPRDWYRVTSFEGIEDTKGNEVTSTSKNLLIDYEEFTMPMDNIEVSVECEKLSYKIKVASTDNGYFTVDKSYANSEETITIVGVPKGIYVVKSVTVTSSDETPITNNSSRIPNVYTFTVPSTVAEGSTITVTGTFKRPW